MCKGMEMVIVIGYDWQDELLLSFFKRGHRRDSVTSILWIALAAHVPIGCIRQSENGIGYNVECQAAHQELWFVHKKEQYKAKQLQKRNEKDKESNGSRKSK